MSRLCLFVALLVICIQVEAFSLTERAAPCKQCRKYCPTGFVLGPDGCPDGCKCCPEYMCMMHCENGFVKENGCDVCRCAKKRDVECPQVLCRMYCENGYVKDENGCDTCECA